MVTKPNKIQRVGSGQDKYVRMLVYGNPGDGKTCLAGTSPKCLILSSDHGTESAAIRGSTADKWEINNWSDMAEAFDYLHDGGCKEYEWVWLDNITSFQESGLDDIMTDLAARKSNRQVWAPDKGEYGQNMNRLGLLLRDMRTLPINVGLITQMMRVESMDGDDVFVPQVQGRGMSEKVCSYVALVGRMVTEEKNGADVFKFTTRKEGGKFYAKDRFGVGTIVDPTIAKIMKRIATARESAAPATVRRPVKKATSTTKARS